MAAAAGSAAEPLSGKARYRWVHDVTRRSRKPGLQGSKVVREVERSLHRMITVPNTAPRGNRLSKTEGWMSQSSYLQAGRKTRLGTLLFSQGSTNPPALLAGVLLQAGTPKVEHLAPRRGLLQGTQCLHDWQELRGI